MKRLLLALVLLPLSLVSHASPFSLDWTTSPQAGAGYGFLSHKAAYGTAWAPLGIGSYLRGGAFILGGAGFRFGPGLWLKTGDLGQHLQAAAALLLPAQEEQGNLAWLETAGQYVSAGITYVPASLGNGPADVIFMGLFTLPLGSGGK